MSLNRKKYNLASSKDMQEILDILEESDIDFSDDDEDVDHTWAPKNRNLEESDDDLSESSTPDETALASILIQQPTVNSALSDTNLNLPTSIATTSTAQSNARSEIWKETAFQNNELPVVLGCNNQVKVGSAMDYFNNYFPEHHFNEAVFFTKMYAMSTFGQELNLLQHEIKNFYGCNIIMGCLGYPRVRMYWAEGFRNETISNSISRDKFMKLRNLIHFVDTSKPSATNKFWRIQPVIDMVRNHCNKLATEITSYSIDEQMIPFSGRSPARQVIRTKPRPVGLKNLVCTTSNGMVVDFEIFQGAGTFLDCGLGHRPSIILRLTKCLPKCSHLYFDRFFTTILLIEKLLEMNFKATGTIMANRLGKRLHFPQDKTMNRGDSHQFVNNGVAAVKWCDTKCVTLVSSKCGKEPVGSVNRWIKNLKRRAPVPIPAVIQDYNAYMGGVDIADQMMEYYRIKIKTKKWPVKVFFHFLDLSIYNSWMEYRRDAVMAGINRKEIKDFLKFKLEVGTVLCSFKGELPQKPTQISLPDYGSKFRPHDAPDDIRFDRYDHWPEFLEGTAKRCRYQNCNSRTRARCNKCMVSLCVIKDKECFQQYHTK